MTDDKVTQYNWGYEIHWAKKERFSGKILVFTRSNCATDMIMHKEKTKSFFVNNGKFKVRWINITNGEIFEAEIKEGAVFDVDSMMPYQLISLEDNGSLSEVSSGDPNNQDNFIIVKSGNNNASSSIPK